LNQFGIALVGGVINSIIGDLNAIIDNKYTAEETGTVTDREWKVSKNTVASG